MHVFVTGSSSCLAQALLPELCSRSDVESVSGVDLRPQRFSHPKYRHTVMNMTSSELQECLRGHDAVVHLGYAVMRGALSVAAQHRNNVDGTLHVFRVASMLGIEKIINMSSTSVYGEGVDLDERAPLAPARVFPYATQKAEIELACARDFPHVVHLRAHLIFGRNAQPFLIKMANAPVLVQPSRRPWPTMQVVHEHDVARAVCLALTRKVRGAFNIAAPEVVTLPDLIRYPQRSVFPVPLRVVKSAMWALSLLGNRDETTWLEVIDTTLTVSCRRAAEELSWKPVFSAWGARAEM